MLILTQVVLSLQLPFAVLPLAMMTAPKKKMGAGVAWLGDGDRRRGGDLVIALNIKLLFEFAIG